MKKYLIYIGRNGLQIKSEKNTIFDLLKSVEDYVISRMSKVSCHFFYTVKPIVIISTEYWFNEGKCLQNIKNSPIAQIFWLLLPRISPVTSHYRDCDIKYEYNNETSPPPPRSVCISASSCVLTLNAVRHVWGSRRPSSRLMPLRPPAMPLLCPLLLLQQLGSQADPPSPATRSPSKYTSDTPTAATGTKPLCSVLPCTLFDPVFVLPGGTGAPLCSSQASWTWVTKMKADGV